MMNEEKLAYREKINLHYFSRKNKKFPLPCPEEEVEKKDQHSSHDSQDVSVFKQKRSSSLKTTKTRGNKSVQKPLQTYYFETFHFNIPEVLTDDFFFRHELTLDDYEKILSGSKKISHLWALALYKKVEVTATSVSSCFMRNVSSNLGGSNKAVVNNLIRKMQTQTQNMPEVQTWQPKIICPHDENIPPLPVHYISGKELALFPSPSTSYPQSWNFQLNLKMPPIECVPCQFYHGYLMLIRIERKSEYEKRFGAPKSLLELPNEYMINHEYYYGVEECFLLQTPEAHQELCKQDLAFLHSLDNKMLWQHHNRAKGEDVENVTSSSNR